MVESLDGGESAGVAPAMVWAGAWLGLTSPLCTTDWLSGVKTGKGFLTGKTRGFRQLGAPVHPARHTGGFGLFACRVYTAQH